MSEAGVSMEEISDWLSSMWHGAVYLSLIGGVRCLSIGCPKMDDEIEKVLQLLEVSLWDIVVSRLVGNVMCYWCQKELGHITTYVDDTLHTGF